MGDNINTNFKDIDTYNKLDINLIKSKFQILTSEFEQNGQEDLLDPIAQLMNVWANKVLSKMPLQSIPLLEDNLFINDHLIIEYNQFFEIVGNFVFKINQIGFEPYFNSKEEVHSQLDILYNEVQNEHLAFIAKVELWMEEDRFEYVKFSYDPQWFMAFFLRLEKSLINEITCKFDEVNYILLLNFLRQILPKINYSQPLAIAASLTYLNEVLVSPGVNKVLAGELDYNHEFITQNLIQKLVKSFNFESVLWRKLGRDDLSAESDAALIWTSFVFGSSDKAHEKVLAEAYQFLGYPDLLDLKTIAPLLLIEIARRVFIGEDSSWISPEIQEPFEYIYKSSFLLGEYSNSNLRLSVEKTYRSILKAELFVRPVSDVLVSLYITNNEPGLAALTLLFFGTRLTDVQSHFPKKDFFKTKNWMEVREQFEKSRLDRLLSSNIALSKEKEKKEENYLNDKYQLLSFLNENNELSNSEEIDVISLHGKYFTKFQDLQELAKLYKIDLVFLGLADSGYCAVIYTPKKKKVIGLQFNKDETRASILNNISYGFSSNDKEFLIATTDFIANTVCDSFQFGEEGMCLVTNGDLSSLPLASSFQIALSKKNKKFCAVSELTDNYFSSKFQPKFNDPISNGLTFKGFAYTVDLENTEKEIDWSKFGLNGSIKTDFNRQEVLNALSQKNRVVHLATHGIYDETLPILSGWLTMDGVLSGIDILNCKLQSDLLISNCCSGDRGGLYFASSGFGPIQIALSNGVKSTLSPSIPIDDEIASIFINHFQKFLSKGYSLTEAFSNVIKELNSSTIKLDWRFYSLKGNSIPILFSPFIIKKKTNFLSQTLESDQRQL